MKILSALGLTLLTFSAFAGPGNGMLLRNLSNWTIDESGKVDVRTLPDITIKTEGSSTVYSRRDKINRFGSFENLLVTGDSSGKIVLETDSNSANFIELDYKGNVRQYSKCEFADNCKHFTPEICAKIIKTADEISPQIKQCQDTFQKFGTFMATYKQDVKPLEQSLYDSIDVMKRTFNVSVEKFTTKSKDLLLNSDAFKPAYDFMALEQQCKRFVDNGILVLPKEASAPASPIDPAKVNKQ